MKNAGKTSSVKRALISVYDKKGLIPFAKGLCDRGVEIISSGGTAKALKEAGIKAIEVSEVTQFPEMLDGRVKTLHPKIHGGILAKRDKKDHVAALKKHKISTIDLIVVSLYPFEETLKKTKEQSKIIEMIDIGGPTMLRSAAKNFNDVTVICDADDYDNVIRELDENNNKVSANFRFQMAAKVFNLTSNYDQIIFQYLSSKQSSKDLPQDFKVRYEKQKTLRYGENPHQKGAVYASTNGSVKGLTHARVLGGKELSFNNYLDLDAAWSIVSAFSEPSACVIKHNNPCGFAIDNNLSRAFNDAFNCDPLSAFGGIVGINRKIDTKLAKTIVASGFLECVVAVGFDKGALDVFSSKKNLRLVQMPKKSFKAEYDFKKITGGLLVQDVNYRVATKKDVKCVTKKKPTAKQTEDLLIGFNLLRFIKSNAIALIKNKRAVGMGMGQPSRVDSVLDSAKKAGERAKGAVLASDGFFPKPDSIEVAVKKGVVAIIQPGGSIQDPKIIEACNKAGVAMLFTGFRHFSH